MTVRPRVLVVDDSAFARKVVRETLERSGLVEVVGIARDGLEALELIQQLRPDVVTLDLVMPDLDGLGVLDALRGLGGPAVVVVSISGADTNLGAAALIKGAVDVVAKPSALATDRMYEMGEELVAKVLAAALARPQLSPVQSTPVRGVTHTRFALLAIGASTGGPRAITSVLSALPSDLPVPVVVALHIPEGYTRALAERISSMAQLKVIEGSDGTPLVPGTAVLVPGGNHSRLSRSAAGLTLAVSNEHDPVHHFKPSIDLLFETAAQFASPVLGVVLTGMGDDGTAGARAIRDAGGAVITEAEESCVVYGMPRSVTEAGLSDGSAPLELIPAALIERLAEK